MKENKNDKEAAEIKEPQKAAKEEPSVEQLIDKLKESMLVEGTKKASPDQLSSMVRHWMNEDKRH